MIVVHESRGSLINALSPDQRKTEQKGGWAAEVAKSPEGSMIDAGPHKHCLL